MGETGGIWLCKPLVGKVDELLPVGMAKLSSTKILVMVEPLPPTTVVEIVEPPSVLKTVQPLPAIIMTAVEPSLIKILGTVEPLPITVV